MVLIKLSNSQRTFIFSKIKDTYRNAINILSIYMKSNEYHININDKRYADIISSINIRYLVSRFYSERYPNRIILIYALESNIYAVIYNDKTFAEEVYEIKINNNSLYF